MAAIALSEPYAIAIRKIGWSVGLEYTFSRVDDLVRLYVAKKEVSITNWHQLVHHKEHGWGLSTDLIGDFFASIGLVRVSRREIQILPCLDALALAYIEISDTEKSQQALRIILGSFIVLADGDIFLNFLAGEFKREMVEARLREMILTKRNHFLQVMKSPQLSNRLTRIISIDVQSTNTGGAAVRKSLSEKRRLQPLEARTAPLSQRIDPTKFEVSNDYFRKVTPKRKDWAASLGLIDQESNLNERGKNFLKKFHILTGSPEYQGIAYWPHVNELERIHLSPEKLNIPNITLWKHINAMFEGLSEATVNSSNPITQNDVSDLLSRMFSTYKSLTPKRSLLRKEMPISVFMHAAVAVFFSKNEALPPLDTLVNQIASNINSTVIYRPSKNFDGMLSIKG